MIARLGRNWWPALVYLGLALVVMARYLDRPDGVLSRTLPDDNVQNQWMLEHAFYCVRHLADPFVSHRMNPPDGVNLMVNTSSLGITVPLVPVTALAGPGVAYLVWMVGGFVLTGVTAAAALARLTGSRAAAFVGGGFFAFAPGVVHHANGQPNLVANFLLPLIVVRVLGLAGTERPVRDGLLLGLLVTWQLFVNEELLLLTAVASGAVLAAYGIGRRVFVALAVTAAVAGPITAYPLWVQFAGPQRYHALTMFHRMREPLAAFATLPHDSLGGAGTPPAPFGPGEQDSWYGWPLLLAVTVLAVLLRRTSKAPAVVALAGAAGSLWLSVDLPVLRFMLPARLAFLTTAGFAVLLALGWDRRGRWARAGIAVVLVVLLPTPVETMPVGPPPRFVTSGQWRAYVPAGTTLVPLPVPNGDVGTGTFRWSVSGRLEFPIAGGYFLGPDERGDGVFAGRTAYTNKLFRLAFIDRKGPPVTPEMRVAVRADLERWQASVVVLDPAADVLRPWLDDLLGPGKRVGDVWLWNVGQ